MGATGGDAFSFVLVAPRLEHNFVFIMILILADDKTTPLLRI